MATDSPQLNPTALPSQYQQYAGDINSAASRYGLDPTVLGGLLVHEGGINSNGVPVVSPAGAIGIAQFIPSTAAGYGVNPWDAKSSIDGAARYLSDLLKTNNGDYTAALASYNEGGGNFAKYGLAGPPGNIYETPGTYAKKVQDIAKSLVAQVSGSSSTPSPSQTPAPVGTQGGPWGGFTWLWALLHPAEATQQMGGVVTGNNDPNTGAPKTPEQKAQDALKLTPVEYFTALGFGAILVIGGIAWLISQDSTAQKIAKAGSKVLM